MNASVALDQNSSLEKLIAEARANYIANNPNSKERYQAAKDVMPGANTRTVLHYEPFPVTIARGEGARIYDVDGHEYSDFLCEYTAGLYGHNNPVIAGAIHAALDEGVTLGGPNMMEAKLARLMCERFPAVERIRFCNCSGSRTSASNRVEISSTVRFRPPFGSN